jgi:hypothetical protein
MAEGGDMSQGMPWRNNGHDNAARNNDYISIFLKNASSD